MASKRLKEATSLLEEEKLYTLNDALDLIKKVLQAKFDETIDIVINLNVDPRHADQMVRGMFRLPNSLGKKVKVAAIVSDKFESDAKEAGADFVGGEELIDEIKSKGVFFDRCVASTDIMSKVGKVAKILGPKGLMPNLKLGTATTDVKSAIKDLKQGQIEYRVEKAGLVHAGVAKLSFPVEKIYENITSFIKEIQKAKPSGAKGTYFAGIHLSSTMGPSLKLDLHDVLNAAA